MPSMLRLAIASVALGMVTLVLLPVHGAALAARHPLRVRVPLWWHRAAGRILRMRVSVEGAPVGGRPLLIVANHVSWTDIVVLGSVMPVCFVAKAEVRDWPVFGWLARLQRTVFIDRNRRGASGRQADEIARRLSGDNDVMVLFAEGTTGDGTRLLPFKSSLVGAAQQALASGEGAFIQPVAIAYTRLGGIEAGFASRLRLSWVGDLDLIPHLRDLLSGPPVDAEVMFGDPIPVGERFDRKAVTRAAEDDIRQRLRQRRRGRTGPSAS